MTHWIKKSFPVAALLFAAGCSSGYKKEFSCSVFPELGCVPTQVVFDRSEGQINDYRMDGHTEGMGKKSNKGAKSRRSNSRITINASAPGSAQMAYVDPGDPVLTVPQVLKILILPWEDKDKDLMAGGYVYIRIGEPEWQILKK